MSRDDNEIRNRALSIPLQVIAIFLFSIDKYIITF